MRIISKGDYFEKDEKKKKLKLSEICLKARPQVAKKCTENTHRKN